MAYAFSRPRRRREPIWAWLLKVLCLILTFFVSQVQKPSVCVYRLFVSVCALGVAWGVALAIWDIMIASGQYYKAMSGGDTVQAFLERVFSQTGKK